MSHTAEAWYVRFPDGRVARAADAEAVRRQLGAGVIPAGCSVRRASDSEWLPIAEVPEFADLAARGRAVPLAAGNHNSTVASRLDPLRLHTLGVGDLVQELTGALDSALVRRKLIPAAAAAVAVGVLGGAAVLVVPQADDPTARGALFGAVGAGAWLVAAFAVALLSRMTYTEVSRLRPARWRESAAGAGRLTVRVAVAHLLVLGAGVGLIWLARQLPAWATGAAGGPRLRGLVASWAVVLALVAEAAVWPVFGFALLLGPLLTVEGCSLASGLRQWARLIQGDTGRVFLYEALAIGLGLVIALPLSLPLLATAGLYADPAVQVAATFSRIMLTCVLLAPVAAYLVVANVFIYLNLRYTPGADR
jgi:hypothetical protein